MDRVPVGTRSRSAEDTRRLPPWLVGLLIGASLAVIAVAASSAVDWFDVAGSTIEGLPFGAALVVVAAASGAIIGGASARGVAMTAHPLRWMALLPLLAGPVGTIVLTALILTHGSDLDRTLPSLFLLVGYSFFYAIPLAIPVSVIGVFLLRVLVPMRMWMATAAVAVLTVPALVVAAGSTATLAGAYGVGPAAPTPVPTLAYVPAVSREHAIAEARPIAADISGDPPTLIEADPYPFGAVVAVDCELGLPPLVEDACGSTAPVWVVFFTITDPDGRSDTAMVVVDGTSAEPLVWGSPFTQPRGTP